MGLASAYFHYKLAATTFAALDLHSSAVQRNELSDQRQANAAALVSPRACTVHAMEAFEDTRLVS
jgi:hypothetical protein